MYNNYSPLWANAMFNNHIIKNKFAQTKFNHAFQMMISSNFSIFVKMETLDFH